MAATSPKTSEPDAPTATVDSMQTPSASASADATVSAGASSASSNSPRIEQPPMAEQQLREIVEGQPYYEDSDEEAGEEAGEDSAASGNKETLPAGMLADTAEDDHGQGDTQDKGSTSEQAECLKQEHLDHHHGHEAVAEKAAELAPEPPSSTWVDHARAWQQWLKSNGTTLLSPWWKLALLALALTSVMLAYHAWSLRHHVRHLETRISNMANTNADDFFHRSSVLTRDIKHNSRPKSYLLPAQLFPDSPEADMTSLRYILTLLPPTHITHDLKSTLLPKLEEAETALRQRNDIKAKGEAAAGMDHSTSKSSRDSASISSSKPTKSSPNTQLVSSSTKVCQQSIYPLPSDLVVVSSRSSCHLDKEICATRDLYLSQTDKTHQVLSLRAAHGDGRPTAHDDEVLMWMGEWNDIVRACMQALLARKDVRMQQRG